MLFSEPFVSFKLFHGSAFQTFALCYVSDFINSMCVIYGYSLNKVK